MTLSDLPNPLTDPEGHLREIVKHSRRLALYEIAVVQALRKGRAFPLPVLQNFGALRCVHRVAVKDKRGALKRAQQHAHDCYVAYRSAQTRLVGRTGNAA